jgi:hypothetical protein
MCVLLYFGANVWIFSYPSLHIMELQLQPSGELLQVLILLHYVFFKIVFGEGKCPLFF